MTDYLENDEDLDDVLGDLSNSDNDKVDSMLIKKILSEMKCEFNRTPVIDDSVKDAIGEASSEPIPNPDPTPPSSTIENGKSNDSCTPSEQVSLVNVNEQCIIEITDSETVQESSVNDNGIDSIVNIGNEQTNEIILISVPSDIPNTVEDTQVDINTNEDCIENKEEVETEIRNEIEAESKSEDVQCATGDVSSTENNSETLTLCESNDTDKSNVETTSVQEEAVPKIVLKLKTSDEEASKKKSRISREAKGLKSQNELSDLDIDIPERRTRRTRNSDKGEPEVAIKRSSRRMSKEYSRESVLQNAIARKEMSFSTFDKPHRRSSRLSEDSKVITGYRTRNRSVRLSSSNSSSNDASEKKSLTPPENVIEDSADDKKGNKSASKKGSANETNSNKNSKNTSRENSSEDGTDSNIVGGALENFSDYDSEKGLESSSSVHSFTSLRKKRKSNGSVTPVGKRPRSASSAVKGSNANVPVKKVEDLFNMNVVIKKG